MKKHKNLIIIALLFFLIPVFSLAQDPLVQTGDDVIRIFENVLNWLWRVFLVATVIAFLLAGFHYLTAMGNPDKVGKANKMVLYGIIGVVVALLAAGMVELIKGFMT